YLENELIRYAVSLPMRFKLRRGTNKWVLRRVADRHLPPPLSRRPKLGFPVDAASYVRPPLTFFRGGFLENWLDLGRRQIEALVEFYPDAAFRLAAAEVWGQLFFQHVPPDEVAERLWASVPAAEGVGLDAAMSARPAEGL